MRLAFILLFFSTPIFAQTITCTLQGSSIPYFLLGMIILRILAEILGFIADKTKNTWDNKAIHFIFDIVNLIAKIIGWFGVGKPRLVK